MYVGEKIVNWCNKGTEFRRAKNQNTPSSLHQLTNFRNKFEAIKRGARDTIEWNLMREYHRLAFDTIREYVNNNIITNNECCLLSYVVPLYEDYIKEQDPQSSEYGQHMALPF